MTDGGKLKLGPERIGPDGVRERKVLSGVAAEIRKSRVRSRPKFTFTMLPDVWDRRLAQVDATGCTYRVAIYLLREFSRTGRKVKLSNVALRRRNVSPRSKRRALKQLAQAGLIAVRQQPKKSPTITVCFAK